MAAIKLLDEETINKIAAGEVIERPASVVKELAENSIDAGAGRILIEIADGGKRFIKITDDGCGIAADDLPLAFQKHATSKIRDAKDISSISTLGFRGEALASIASVSRSVAVVTRTAASLSGSYLRLEEGRIAERKEVGAPYGTSITVWDLFYNVPARRKHLKGAEAESVYIADAVSEMAIIHHDISFELYSGRRTVFKSVRSPSWNDVLIRLFGLKTVKGMAHLEAEGPGWSLTGLAGEPSAARSSPDRIFIFVNGRAVSSRSLSSALREAYRNIIPQGKSPTAVVSLRISPELVDVNVHPTKREIRLLHEQEIASVLTAAAVRALQEQGSSYRDAGSVKANGLAESIDFGQQPGLSLPSAAVSLAESCAQSTLPIEVDELQPSAGQAGRPRLKILGQIRRLYIVAESEEGLVLIDQHAAAERIRFERLVELYRSKRIRQDLAEPVAVELSASERIMLSSWQQTLQEIGFDIQPFGGNSFSVRAVPALGRRLESAEAVHDVLRDLFSSGRPRPDSSNRDDILKLLACRGSIKSGKKLTLGEMKSLVDELFRCKSPQSCPHGRPVTVTFDEAHLEKIFARR
ncbi:MAG TPA: DNA mismatch repair endonuclease MutL [Methanothrix sp.]|nr:DNA mismatch repair endonuclease MutL [Methanothrix sp.]HPC88928.1 DNA mismatch repair endonuclease MutL [Methanothrix sp.]HQE86862.1 DNA mismatch repair endonuclease MutL [Methanothrix sp.]HQI67527.1 DNA mismatch repair endonuclease MutL [Methanothrix sp.]HRS85301.1 DNA mismatch repair endonuclease MutL [Methanothrix sp.]